MAVVMPGGIRRYRGATCGPCVNKCVLHCIALPSGFHYLWITIICGCLGVPGVDWGIAGRKYCFSATTEKIDEAFCMAKDMIF